MMLNNMQLGDKTTALKSVNENNRRQVMGYTSELNQ